MLGSVSTIYVSAVIFSTEQIKEINREIQKFITDDSAENSQNPALGKKGKFNLIPCAPMLNYLYPYISEIQKANMKFFGYDIFFYLGTDQFNYNVYDGKTKDEYDWHTDGTQMEAPSDIKLTCLLNLSEEPYEGGDFLCFPDYNDPEKEEYKNLLGQFRIPGTILLFHPSRPHKVLPVTKGKRITLTYWAEGPSSK